MLFVVPLLPLLAGLVLWPAARAWTRGRLLAASLAAVLGAGAVLLAAGGDGTAAWSWGGPLEVSLAVTRATTVASLLVIGITAPVVVYAAWHEDETGLSRLVGLLVAFAGAMLLLVLAADLLTLAVGFELTAVTSWALIAHRWRDTDTVARAAHAFNVTRLGGLGLFVAAGAAVAGVGGLGFEALTGLEGWPLHAFTAGLLTAAAAKSGLLPFSPWLFSAMAGPTPVSALLHSAAMVAAGAWALIRLHEPLSLAGWFGPVAIALGLATALAGGVVAAVQPRAKELLAASTSAHYGLMVAAVGAGAAGAALSHLVAHGAAKALLFLAAGIALGATGSPLMGDHRLGRWRGVAATVWIGALALAAVPPLGAAWTKEQVVAGLGHVHPAWAVLGAVAGGLSAFYALRFATLIFGRGRSDAREHEGSRPGWAEWTALGWLAVISLLLGVLWVTRRAVVETLTGLTLHPGTAWELVLSLGLVGVAALAVRVLARRDRLVEVTTRAGARSVATDWFGLPAVSKIVVVDPVLALAAACARFDDRVVDAGVEVAGRTGEALARVWSGLTDAAVDRSVHAAAGGAAGLAGRSAGADDRGLDRAVDAVAAATATLATASGVADDRGIDRGVGGTASGIGELGRNLRRTQTGLVHHYYAYVVGGLVVTVGVLSLLR